MGLARALGIDDGPWLGLDVGSPFDYPRQGILYVAAHLREPGRDGLDESVLDEMAELIEAAGGRTLALFSSWRGVDRAADYLPVRLGPDIPVLVQQRGDPVGPLVEKLSQPARIGARGDSEPVAGSGRPRRCLPPGGDRPNPLHPSRRPGVRRSR